MCLTQTCLTADVLCLTAEVLCLIADMLCLIKKMCCLTAGMLDKDMFHIRRVSHQTFDSRRVHGKHRSHTCNSHRKLALLNVVS